MDKFKFVVIGAGSAGVICATYLKKYWADDAEVVLIYDHSKPGIGVGESLSPIFLDYTNYVGITREELVENVNATVKLGLRFENWLNDGDHFYQSFNHYPQMDYFNHCAAYDISHGQYDNDTGYSRFFHDNFLIPANPNATQTVHIDAVLFSKYVENKFRDTLTILDDEVLDIIKKPGTEEIDSLVLKNRGRYSGDFFIDATGFQRVLFNKLNTRWVDMKKWLPIDRCIPNPLPYDFKQQPTYTNSQASKDGWILQVPLSNRWGTGYLYSSEFTTDEQAFESFELFVNSKYKSTLNNTSKVLSFSSGYWEDQWVGNCISVGLCSGFAEPLEATNLHHTVYQIVKFVEHFNFKNFKHDQNTYNRLMRDMYDNIYLYLRFCYATKRTDSEFWKFMTHTVPDDVQAIIDKISKDVFYLETIYPTGIFIHSNFTKVAFGLKMIDRESYLRYLNRRKLMLTAKQMSEQVNYFSIQERQTAINHREYIESIVNSRHRV